MSKERYYSTPYNDCELYIEKFNNCETKLFLSKFYNFTYEIINMMESTSVINGFKNRIGSLILSLPVSLTKNDITPTFLLNIFYELKSLDSKTTIYSPKAWKVFFIFILENKFFTVDELNMCTDFIDIFNDVQNVPFLIVPVLESTKTPDYFNFCKYPSTKNNKNEIISLIEFDTNNKFIQNLLISYMKEHFLTFPRVYTLPFFKEFGSSLGEYTPSSIYEFNINTLTQQVEYFKDHHSDTCYALRHFYLYILKEQGLNPTITLRDGVNEIYISKSSFIEYFSTGYRLVPLNPHEDYPNSDRWSVTPNGSEALTSTEKSYDVFFIDFSRVKDYKLRECCKKWFWYSSNSALSNRYRLINYIFEFIEFRESLRDMHLPKFIMSRATSNIEIEDTILTEEIVSYTTKWSNELKHNSYCARISPLKLFLEFIIEENLYNVELACFEYLSLKKNIKTESDIPAIPKDEFTKLVKELEKKANENDLHKLYYIIFCLITLTPFRISTILDLKCDCVIEKGRKGIYAIKSVVKSSNGDKRDIQISLSVKRLIDVALTLTSIVRVTAPKNVKNLLFLVNNHKNKYKSIPESSFRKYLLTVCKSLGLETYSAQNLRKTYMTNIVENAIKENVSLMNLKEITGHSNFDITDNHYVKSNIRKYLEATNGIEIGNIPIIGSTVENYNDNCGNENIVNDNCGYCRNADCSIEGTANCLMCKGFVTTPEHIKYFQEGVNVITSKIVNSTNEHDKEHLYALKRLYLAYIERLYLIKEES